MARTVCRFQKKPNERIALELVLDCDDKFVEDDKIVLDVGKTENKSKEKNRVRFFFVPFSHTGNELAWSVVLFF